MLDQLVATIMIYW